MDCGNAEYLERIHTALNMWQKSGLCAWQPITLVSFRNTETEQPVIIIISISESYYDKLCYCSYFDKSEATSLEHFRHICKANFYSNVSVVVHAVDNKTPLYVITDLYGPSRL